MQISIEPRLSGQRMLLLSICLFQESNIFCALTFKEIMLIFREWCDLQKTKKSKILSNGSKIQCFFFTTFLKSTRMQISMVPRLRVQRIHWISILFFLDHHIFCVPTFKEIMLIFREWCAMQKTQNAKFYQMVKETIFFSTFLLSKRMQISLVARLSGQRNI